MRNLRFLFCLLFCLVVLAGCGREFGIGVHSATLTLADMKCLECAERVTQVLSDMDGVSPESILCDTDTGAVSFSYDKAKLSLKKIEQAVANVKMCRTHVEE